MGEEKKGITLTVNQLVVFAAAVLLVWFGGKWCLSAGVKYVRAQVRAEVVSVISDISGGKINLDEFSKKDGGKKLLPFLSGDEIGE